jgi:predicted MPP superfamily phosphohydrolase
MWMLIFWVLPLAGIAYLAWHLWTLLPLNGWWKAAVIVIGVGCFLLMFLSMARKFDNLPLWLASTCYNIGTSSIIVMLYMVIIFLVLDFGRLLRLVPRDWLYANWTTTGVLAALLIGIFTYGYLHYQHKYRKELTLTTNKPLQREYKLVMLSDLHLGYHNRRSELARWVDLLNDEHADAILIAGDIIDGSMRPLLEERMAEEFHRLNAPVYACLGNHEYYAGDSSAVKFYKDAGICLLRDSVARVGELAIIGRDDRFKVGRSSLQELLSEERRVESVELASALEQEQDSADSAAEANSTPNALHSKYYIVLDHQPFNLDRTAAAGVDFQLSGHTHHGQIWPVSWITQAIYECAFGDYQVGNTRFYVTSGMGIWGGRFRIGTCSEYVVATLKHED